MRLEAREITAGYGASPVLSDVSLSIEQGECVGLLGLNGSGKSTLLRAMTGAIKPSAGQVLLDGKPTHQIPNKEFARKVGFVPQSAEFTFEFSVQETVLMGRFPHLRPFQSETEADYQIVNESMRLMDITSLADRPVTLLSGGEQRRVLVARALAQSTSLLLLDEPTANLDLRHQYDVLSLVRDRCKQGALGAIFALHDINQASEFCDRLLLLHEGKCFAAGKPSEVLTAENLRQVYGIEAELIAHPQTNQPLLLTYRRINSPQ